MARKPVLLDGAIGTSLWKLAEENGIEKVPVWRYNAEHPELVRELTRRYIDAGAKVLLCNTFGVNPMQLKRTPQYTVADIVRRAVEIVREEAEGTDCLTALSTGPLTEFMEPYGDLTEEEVEEIYGGILAPGVEAGAQVIVPQTFLDLGMMRVVVRTARRFGLPIYAMMTFEAHGKTLMGNGVSDIVEALEDEVDAIGMNCSLGPDKAVPIIREFRDKTKKPVIFKPNAGLPITAMDGKSVSPYTAEMFVKEIAPAIPYVDLIGGCCGTDPEYIRLLKEAVDAQG